MAIELPTVKCTCKQSHCKECHENQGSAGWSLDGGVNAVDKLQNRDEVKKQATKPVVDSKYGAWGDKYKNKDNFANMHWG